MVEGIGDDCAVLRVCDRLLLVSCDLSVEGVHFRRRYGSPEDIGWKAAASSLSDIAAMGGAPLFGLVSLACPGNRGVSFVEGVYDGLIDAMSQCGAVIVGGDTTRSQEYMTLDVIVIGETIGNRYLSRKGGLGGRCLGRDRAPRTVECRPARTESRRCRARRSSMPTTIPSHAFPKDSG